MKMLDKILNYFKSIFLYIIAILGIVLFVLGLCLGTKSHDKDEARRLEDEEKERIRLAKEEEQRKLLETLQKLKEDKEVRDDKIEKVALEEHQQLNEVIEAKVEESVKNGSNLAQNIANKFGAKYVKISDE